MSTWTNTVRNSMGLTQPDVHTPNETLAAQFGPKVEPLLREMGSALAVLIDAVERIAPGEFLDNDPMALRQAQEAHLRYVRAANEYVEPNPSVYRTRTESAASPLAMMDRVWADIADHEGCEVTTRHWYLGTTEQGSDGRSKIVLGSFANVTGQGTALAEYDTIVLLAFGDSEMGDDEYRITVFQGDKATEWMRHRRIGGGFWEESRAARFATNPLA